MVLPFNLFVICISFNTPELFYFYQIRMLADTCGAFTKVFITLKYHKYRDTLIKIHLLYYRYVVSLPTIVFASHIHINLQFSLFTENVN